jgi:hypothetical protein
MEIQYRCPRCLAVADLNGWERLEALDCSACGVRLPLLPESRPDPTGTLGRCPVCGGQELYVQRDFNRRVGLLLVIAGALLAWPTRGVSLVVVVLLDLALYLVVPEIAICYRCEAVFRGLKRNPRHQGFSLATEEKYRVIRAHDRESRLAGSE